MPVPPSLGKEVVRQRATVPKCLGGTPPTKKLPGFWGLRRRLAERVWSWGLKKPGAKLPWQRELGWAGQREAGAPSIHGSGFCRAPPSPTDPVWPQASALWRGSHHHRAKPSWTHRPHTPLLATWGLGRTKPGDLKSTRQSLWVNDDQFLPARNSFSKNALAPNACSYPFSSPRPHTDSQRALGLAQPQKNSSVGGGPRAPWQGWPGARMHLSTQIHTPTNEASPARVMHSLPAHLQTIRRSQSQGWVLVLEPHRSLSKGGATGWRETRQADKACR